MSSTLTLIATTAFGLEAITKREILSLGYPAEIIAPGWIRFSGDWTAICRANLWLRTADRVLTLDWITTSPIRTAPTLRAPASEPGHQASLNSPARIRIV